MSIREIVSGEKVEGLVEAGTVQVSGKATVEDVTRALAEAAEAEGAVAFRVTAAGGNNKMFGNAVYYVEA